MEEQFQQLKTVTEKLKLLLRSFPDLAFDDDKLFMTFYFYQLGKDNMNTMSAYDFFTYLIDDSRNKVKIETLSRIKRKVLSDLKVEGYEHKPIEKNDDLLFQIKNF